MLAPLVSLAVMASAVSAQYTATYTPNNLPATTEDGQSGTNQCSSYGASSQTSMCQNAYVNSIDDFCLWAPPSTTSEYGNSAIGNTERIEVAWCMKSGYGTRLIPDGTITGAHFLVTSQYAQITGVGDLTKLNIPAGDDGGELDPHGADGLGNPIGGIVFSSAFGGGTIQIHEWTNFMSSGAFCFRVCTGSNAAEYCEHIYDTLGCNWNIPGSYDQGSFDQCQGDAVEPMGVYGTSTFYQGDASTPDAHAPSATSNCQSYGTISNGVAAAITVASATSSSASSSVATSSAASSAASGSASASSAASIASSTIGSVSSVSSVSRITSATAGASLSASRLSSSLAGGASSGASASGGSAAAAASSSRVSSSNKVAVFGSALVGTIIASFFFVLA